MSDHHVQVAGIFCECRAPHGAQATGCILYKREKYLQGPVLPGAWKLAGSHRM